MGLLGDFEDPKTQGLLSLGLGLLNSRGNFGQGLGQAGMQAMDVMRQARQDQQRSEAMKQQQAMQAIQMQAAQQQLAEQQRAATEAEAQRGRDEQFRSAIPAPVGQSMAQGPTEFGNFNLAGPADPRQMMLWQAMKNRQIKPMEWFTATQKDNTPIKLGAGEKLLEAGTYRPLADNPKDEAKDKDLERLKVIYGEGTPAYAQALQAYGLKMTTHTPPVNVSVNMDKGFGEAFAKDAAGSLATSRDQAKAAANTIQTIDRINQTLDTGKVAIGPTSKFETFGRQLGETIGVGGKGNAEVLANTRKVIQGAAALAVDGAAALKGQGQITEGERALVSRAAGGDVDSLTAPEIRSLTGVLRKINGQRITSHQQQLGNVGKQFQPFVPFYQVDMPTEPTSVDALLKKYGG